MSHSTSRSARSTGGRRAVARRRDAGEVRRELGPAHVAAHPDDDGDHVPGRRPRRGARRACDRRPRGRSATSGAASMPATARSASAAASAAAGVTNGSRSLAAVPGADDTDTSSDAPAGATQVRPRRPRPAVWRSATTTRPVGRARATHVVVRVTVRRVELPEPAHRPEACAPSRAPSRRVTGVPRRGCRRPSFVGYERHPAAGRPERSPPCSPRS